jgi:hypothetical protein
MEQESAIGHKLNRILGQRNHQDVVSATEGNSKVPEHNMPANSGQPTDFRCQSMPVLLLTI